MSGYYDRHADDGDPMVRGRAGGSLATGEIAHRRDENAVMIGALVRAKLQQLAWSDARQ
ncbi:hypothetical protein K3M67_20315 (plasmid) [Sphingobium sp. V4]|uniref:hypothetical protein n=1 Tax=Sphingobium sp. V4 TaxID=3038927 RepID=UPI0025582785|nr:hypothetical protein [Sphingobium sp. V4]WIW90376.1 hypothetical protein K3M67_20315 [Sphingobium sp. V4]